MCGVEVLLICCAAGTVGGCCAGRKLNRKGEKKNSKKKGVKGEGETFTKSSASKKENRATPSGRTPEDKKRSQQKSRLTAYEEYTQKPQKVAEKDAKPKRVEVAQEGVMDAQEFKRLQKYREKQRLKGL